MTKRSVNKAVAKPGDLTISKAAKLLKRSYSWVYTHLKDLGRDQTVRYKGVIFIRAKGFEKLAAKSALSPKRGRPRMIPSF